jgi:hypothetical protein
MWRALQPRLVRRTASTLVFAFSFLRAIDGPLMSHVGIACDDMRELREFLKPHRAFNDPHLHIRNASPGGAFRRKPAI